MSFQDSKETHDFGERVRFAESGDVSGLAKLSITRFCRAIIGFRRRTHCCRVFLLLFLLGVAAYGCRSRPLPVLNRVHNRAVVDASGDRFYLSRLHGKVWVANAIFTTCPVVCPVMTLEMKALQRMFKKRKHFHLASFTVDPQTDTPAVLRRYARSQRVNTKNWYFLTGTPAQMRVAIQDELKLSVGQRVKNKGDMDITHSVHMVLVDAHMRIRGYFPSGKEGRESIASAIHRLLEEH